MIQTKVFASGESQTLWYCKAFETVTYNATQYLGAHLVAGLGLRNRMIQRVNPRPLSAPRPLNVEFLPLGLKPIRKRCVFTYYYFSSLIQNQSLSYKLIVKLARKKA